MRITLLDGHPRGGSLGAALADAYARGAEAGGHELRRLTPRDMAFDPVHRGYKEAAPLEPDLAAAQADIAWCEHLVVVHPVWWGSMPAQLKGFFDRTFTPGWAFKFHEGKIWWDRLLAGRSARVIQTSATPKIAMRLAYFNCAPIAVKDSTLAFCGFKPVRLTQFGGVGGGFKPEKARPWLAKCERLGQRGV
ncbi:NAD(P)H-dependent oxidoreductase [Botrimarina sp.]|uniref:NAD(P)H-dependent oxidoreductase n=1 Tax=Botrimarina sp. TaxID=2795802 RepID=UPI0032EE6E19